MSGHDFKAKIRDFQKRFLPYRRIRANKAGLWFTGLMASMGFLTLLSENNILFLLFSCQIAVVIISGVLSEYSVSRLEFRRFVHPSFAGEAAKDIWVLKNHGRIPAFHVTVGEWINEEWVSHAVYKMILPGQSVSFPSKFIYPRRGSHSWDGLACGSDFPFGFSQKIRIDRDGGTRLIWPEKADGRLQKLSAQHFQNGGSELREGEVRSRLPGETWNDVLRFRRNLDGTPLMRSRGRPHELQSFQINLDTISADELEESVRIVSSLVSSLKLNELQIIHHNKIQRVSQPNTILDRVALIQKGEEPWFQKSAS